jgi:ubiquinone/menaquinone biosynthesis C-methylase UbiE
VIELTFKLPLRAIKKEKAGFLSKTSDYDQTVNHHYNQISKCFDYYPIAAKVDRKIFLDKMPASNRGKALDIGCGTGRTVYDLSNHFDEVYGIDLSAGMIKVAQNRLGANKKVVLKQSNVKDLDFPDEFFDYIVSHTTFHHLKSDLVPTLEKVKRILKPGGKIVLIDIIGQGLMRRHAPLVRRIGAFLTFIIETFKSSPLKALKKFKVSVDPFWMEHLKTDEFLEKEDFVEKYSSVFKNAKFEKITREFGLNHLMIVEWIKET